MMAMLRLAAILLVIQGVSYLSLTIYLRSLERERLEGVWERDNPGGARAARAAFVGRRMQGFHRTLRARLVALVLVLPFVAVMLIVYLVNHN
ncbi:hypothetical protein GI374_07170 [Paracoccus sp. S-4012]|nr:hypothetical protein [Paracoccus sp. S-4012]